MSALFVDLAWLTYANALSFQNNWESDDKSFRLHVLELLEIDVAYSHVPQFQVGFSFEAFGKHVLLRLVRIEDEHSTFSSTVSYESTVVFHEAPSIVESLWPNETRFFVMVGTCRKFLR